eukprot:5400651-Pleurochrysis_carterae.AAC.1
MQRPGEKKENSSTKALFSAVVEEMPRTCSCSILSAFWQSVTASAHRFVAYVSRETCQSLEWKSSTFSAPIWQCDKLASTHKRRT